MRGRTLPADYPAPANLPKPEHSQMGKHSRGNNYQHGARKKRKLTLETETLNPVPNPIQKKKQKRHPYSRNADRKWVFSTRDFSNYKDKVVFVSYNILGVENASKHPDLYCNVQPKYLDWEHRKKLICKEMTLYNPSIMCFQEVDRFDDLDKLLQKDGFRGVYQARTGETCDGCAIFWKHELFTLLHQENIEFKTFGLRDNVAQVCVLKMIRNQAHTEIDGDSPKMVRSRSLVVANIHVLFNPSRGDIKLGQVRLFLKKTHEISQAWGNIPAIIGGDLNSMPQSAMYQFLVSSELDILQHERKKISGQICPLENPVCRTQNNTATRFHMSVSRPLIHRWSDEELRLATGTEGLTYLMHNLKLCSAYLGVPGSRLTRDIYGEPLATSFHSKFMGTVDYIWHTKELVPVRVLETLPIDILRKAGGLPSKRWGSDHLALVCELAFVDEDVDQR